MFWFSTRWRLRAFLVFKNWMVRNVRKVVAIDCSFTSILVLFMIQQWLSISCVLQLLRIFKVGILMTNSVDIKGKSTRYRLEWYVSFPTKIFRIRKSRRNRPFLNCQNICNFSFDLYSNSTRFPSVYIFKDPSNTISVTISKWKICKNLFEFCKKNNFKISAETVTSNRITLPNTYWNFK